MLVQYLEIKAAHPDAILFYRMGDFYEMFFEDALLAAPISRGSSPRAIRMQLIPIPLCGVPYHAATQYLQKLVAKGHKVAICEQVEDAAVAKGLIKREVVRVVTPALVGDPDLVPIETRNILVTLCEDADGTLEVATLDLLAGSLRAGKLIERNQLVDLFLELNPKEALIPDALFQTTWWKDLVKIFPQMLVTRRDLYFATPPGADPIDRPAAALASYLRETQKVESIPYLSAPSPLFETKRLTLDATTTASLEILKGSEARGNTLYEILDTLLTPMGRRNLKDWLIHPLCQLGAIEERHDAVQAFFENPAFAQSVREQLSLIRDLERLTTKSALGLSMPRDLVAIREIAVFPD